MIDMMDRKNQSVFNDFIQLSTLKGGVRIR